MNKRVQYLIFGVMAGLIFALLRKPLLELEVNFWMAMILIKPRFFFEGNLKFINRLLIIQGFDIQLPSV